MKSRSLFSVDDARCILSVERRGQIEGPREESVRLRPGRYGRVDQQYVPLRSHDSFCTGTSQRVNSISTGHR